MPYGKGCTVDGAVRLSGWGKYTNGNTTPINIPAATPTPITLATSTGVVDESNLPAGVTTLWDDAQQKLDLSSLQLGDRLGIRLDGLLTNTGFNESFRVDLTLAEGTAKERVIPFASGNRLFAGTAEVSRYNIIVVDEPEILSSLAGFTVITTDIATMVTVDMLLVVN